jgi:hypothetical protein
MEALQEPNLLGAKQGQGDHTAKDHGHLLKLKQSVAQPLHAPLVKLHESTLHISCI